MFFSPIKLNFTRFDLFIFAFFLAFTFCFPFPLSFSFPLFFHCFLHLLFRNFATTSFQELSIIGFSSTWKLTSSTSKFTSWSSESNSFSKPSFSSKKNSVPNLSLSCQCHIPRHYLVHPTMQKFHHSFFIYINILFSLIIQIHAYFLPLNYLISMLKLWIREFSLFTRVINKIRLVFRVFCPKLLCP